ncbi:MAG: hypothetical protein E8D49_00440 [Nitrospira sp.]|nr:MAG: hypothetical protein E8D49_00440 [Nitrospira sp.]
MVRFHAHVPRFNPSYESRIAEEEATLRWLIARQPRSRELSYYLLFLLAANGKDEQAIEECLQILKRYPDDQIAHMWRETIRLRWHRTARRQVSARQITRNRR